MKAFQLMGEDSCGNGGGSTTWIFFDVVDEEIEVGFSAAAGGAVTVSCAPGRNLTRFRIRNAKPPQFQLWLALMERSVFATR